MKKIMIIMMLVIAGVTKKDMTILKQYGFNDMFEPYLIPQDCGLRCDNRWLDMSNGSGQGLRFAMDEPFNFNAYHYSTDNLTKAVYTYQLQQRDGITLNLDYNTTGVGCTACYVLPGYQVKPTRYERRLTIKPISK